MRKLGNLLGDVMLAISYVAAILITETFMLVTALELVK